MSDVSGDPAATGVNAAILAIVDYLSADHSNAAAQELRVTVQTALGVDLTPAPGAGGDPAPTPDPTPAPAEDPDAADDAAEEAAEGES